MADSRFGYELIIFKAELKLLIINRAPVFKARAYGR